MLLISTTIWDGLNDQEKTWLEEAARESVVYERKIWKEAENHALEEIKKAGVEVIYPDKEPFRKRCPGCMKTLKKINTLRNS